MTTKHWYMVHAVAPAAGWTHKPGYFPRHFHYKSEAVKCAREALKAGAKHVWIDGPQGKEFDSEATSIGLAKLAGESIIRVMKAGRSVS